LQLVFVVNAAVERAFELVNFTNFFKECLEKKKEIQTLGLHR
jgi:hypothetical protein